MDSTVWTAFMDELSKIASNMAAPPEMKSGMGSNLMVSSKPSVGLPKPTKDPSAKPTNYSIVNTQSPGAAFGTASSSSKSTPPPAVRT